MYDRRYHDEGVKERKKYEKKRNLTPGNPGQPAIINGGAVGTPGFIQVHHIAHDRKHSPPKVYYGKTPKDDSKVVNKIHIENTAQPRITGTQRMGSSPGEIARKPKVSQPEQLVKVAKNKMGTLQVNQNVDLKALFCD